MNMLMKSRYRLSAPMITALPMNSVPTQLVILHLQPLRVIGGQAGKDQHAEAADHERHRARLQEQVLTTLAMIRPITPMIRKLPMPDRSFLVV